MISLPSSSLDSTYPPVVVTTKPLLGRSSFTLPFYKRRALPGQPLRVYGYGVKKTMNYTVDVYSATKNCWIFSKLNMTDV